MKEVIHLDKKQLEEKLNSKQMVTKDTTENPNVIVTIGKDVTKLTRIFGSGKEVGSDNKSVTICYGYKEFHEFVNDYVNLIMSAYQFLENESEADGEAVAQAMEGIFKDTLEALRNGDYQARLTKTEAF
jgi:hypothetical protein